MKPGADAPLEDSLILKNLADRLLVLAADTEQVCKTVSVLTADLNTALASDTIKDLQKLDNLYQSLCDLAGLSTALSVPNEHRAQALRHLKLKSTVTLLERNNTPKQTDRMIAQGSVDFF